MSFSPFESYITLIFRTDIRADGRAKTSSRRCTISLGAETGHVDVTMGATRVVASVSGDIVEPSGDKPNDGLLSFQVDFSPMASPYFDSSRPSLRSVEVSRIIDRCVKESGAVDTELLCVISGFRVWALRVDIRVMNYEGNLVDACVAAAVAALRYFRRPEVTVINTSVTVHTADEKPPVELRFHHIPISSTFAYFKDIDAAVVDPTLAEELSADSYITIATNLQKEVCCVHKGGGASITRELLLECVHEAHKRTLAIGEAMKAQLDAKFKELSKEKTRAEYAAKYHLPGVTAASAKSQTVPSLIEEDLSQGNLE